ncbi:MAG: hypothetical protein H7301_07845 [Cryobacterium sp.]|nr:hypothetical protein [Oligoflexia bacterium]
MKARPLASIALFVCLTLISAVDGYSSEARDCRFDSRDPFEPDSHMPFGSHRGACMRNQEERNYRILNAFELSAIPALARYHAKEFTFVANLKHANQFWVAVIPKVDAVDRVIYELERVPPKWLAAHTMVRFTFKAGKEALLFSQTDFRALPIKMSSVLISVTAMPMLDGPEYNLLNATQDNFGLARTLLSPEQVMVRANGFNHQVDQIELFLPAGKSAQGYFDSALVFNHDPVVSDTYHTVYRNCVTTLFHGLDQYLGYRPSRLKPLRTLIPVLTLKALEDRKLVTEASIISSLNAEFPVR